MFTAAKNGHRHWFIISKCPETVSLNKPEIGRAQQGIHSNKYWASIWSFMLAKPRNCFSELVGNQMIIAGSSQQWKRGIFILKKLAMPGIRSSELVRNQKAEVWISQKRKMGNNTDSWISDAQKSFLWSRCNQSQGDFELAHYRSFLL